MNKMKYLRVVGYRPIRGEHPISLVVFFLMLKG